MNTNILPSEPNIRFEPHRSTTAEFPFVIHPHVTRNRSTFSLHENIELIYFLDGEGFMVYDGAPFAVHKGDIAVINSYSLHKVIPNVSLPHFCLIIDKNFCRDHGVDHSELIFQKLIRDDPQATHLVRQIMEVYEDSAAPFYNTAIKCAVLNMLLYLCRRYSTPASQEQQLRSPSLEHVRSAIGFMKANLSRKLCVDEIAANAGLSKFYFLREFKRITGYTPTHYLNTIRCEYARNLLESGQYSVKEIAFLCGFTNNSYFSNVFRQHTGLLPSQVHPATPPHP